MAEDEIHPITEEDVRRYLVAKGTTDKCFSCGQNGWYMDGGEHGLYRCLPWGRRGDDKLSSAVVLNSPAMSQAVVTMMCTNCGFVRMHDTYMIVLWLRRNRIELEP